MILAKAESGPVFFKDMSYYVMPHILADGAFLDRVTHSFLVRDPRASITSYAKLDPDFTLEELGIEAQWRMSEGLVARGHFPVVVQSEQVQADPRGQMQRYWNSVGLSDKPTALEWGDAAPSDWQQVAAWHQDVISSKTIRPLTEISIQKTATDFEKLVAAQPRFQEVLEHHMPYYQKLLARSGT
jgi:hypothetical protein